MPPYFTERRTGRLERQIEFMIKAHQMIVNLLETPDLEDILEELSEPERRKAIAADPLRAAREAKVNLPQEGVAIQIFELGENWQVEVQIELMDSLLVMGFHSHKGFFTIS